MGLFGDWLKGGGGGGGGGRCFLAGTQVLTPAGEVPVEHLKAGDLVTTRSGTARPIVRFLVMPTVQRSGDGWPAAEMPVLIERGALAANTPHRDLYLSQSHMLLIDGIFIPAGYLVNGDTIRVSQPADVERLVYYHIELAEHDVVLAEGAPCESFVEEYVRTFAPVVKFGGLRSKVASRLRSAVSPFVDIRNHADVVRDRLEDRAEVLRAA